MYSSILLSKNYAKAHYNSETLRQTFVAFSENPNFIGPLFFRRQALSTWPLETNPKLEFLYIVVSSLKVEKYKRDETSIGSK